MPGWFLTVIQQNLFLLITRLKRERLPNNTFIGEENYNSWHLYLYFLFAIIYEILKADILEFFFSLPEISVRFDKEKGFISS